MIICCLPALNNIIRSDGDMSDDNMSDDMIHCQKDDQIEYRIKSRPTTSMKLSTCAG